MNVFARTFTALGGSGAEAASFRGLANSMDGSDGLLEPLVCGEGNSMVPCTKYKQRLY